MRMLFTTLPMLGHFHPLVPIARAAQEAGHDVAIASAASFAPYIERAGFQALAAGVDSPTLDVAAMFPGRLLVPEYTGAHWIVANVFAGVFAPVMAATLLQVCATWHPDLIVREAAEFGGCAAAETLGLPHASVRTGAFASSYARREIYREQLERLRLLQGLPPDPTMAMPFRYLHLAAEPPGLAGPADPPGPTTHLIGAVDAAVETQPAPAWLANMPAVPTVYATLGTVMSGRPSGLAIFMAILAALRDEPINLILTVGRDNDPAQFGPQPPNVHIERYIPQSALLPYCDLVVHQGGFGTVVGTLAAGLPMVVLPISADQPINAAACVAMGVGQMLGEHERTPEAVRTAVRAVLADPGYRAAAERTRAAMAALPGLDHAVALLERLATERQPILSDAAVQPA